MIRWSETQRDLREGIAKIAEAAGTGHIERDAPARFSQRGWELLRESGLFGLPFDEEWGGLGQDLPTTMYVLEGLGYGCPDAGLNFSAATHIVSAGVPLQRFGSAALKERYLPGICAGTVIGAHAISEPSAGSDMFAMLTTAAEDGADYVLNGTKAFVTNGPIADVIVVYARTGGTAVAGITPFLVPRDTPGLTVGRPIGKMGLRTSPLSELSLEDVRVPRENVIGSVGAGFLILNEVMQWEILCGFVIVLGEMQRRLERCVDYARTRVQFGTHIGANQSVAGRVVEMRMDAETSRKWLYDTAQRLRDGEDVAVDIAATKLVVSESNVRSALSAVQIFGGYGYTTEYGLEKNVRDAVSGTIYSGTSEIQRQRIAALMGLDRAKSTTAPGNGDHAG